MELTDIYNHKGRKDAARLKLAKWFDKVGKLAGNAFQTVIDTADCNLLFGLPQYKDAVSDYRQWNQESHADEYFSD